MIEGLLEVLIFGPILLFILGLLLAIPATVLAVSLVMDGGCLRYLLFGLGWLLSIFYGLLVGAVVGDGLLGLQFLVEPIAHLFMWGYPIAAWWAHRRFEAMPPEQYRAWDQTLTGGALLGFGAGSVAGLLRSVGGGFGGFGGGSFGGGGASGSWSGASGTASASGGGGASSAAAGTGATGGSAQTAAVSAGAVPGAASEPSSDAATKAPARRGVWARLRDWFQKFQWYHGLAFVLVTLVFVPLGLGTMKALQNTEFLVFVLVVAVLYGGYRLARRRPAALQSAVHSVRSFRGGEASSSWS